MIKEAYVYTEFENKTLFFFQSEGQNGKITKSVLFSNLGNLVWNLGFGDFEDGEINDSIVSNNHDIIKVISTVAKIAHDFSNEYPLRRIRIKPVDEKRRQLYNHVFRRNHETISNNFQIIGRNGLKREIYRPDKYYQYFELKRKLEQ